MTPTLELRDAVLGFGARTLWSGLTLDVQPGEFLAVLGSNGSGKTSLLKVLLGLQSLTSGSVQVTGTSPRAARQCVGYVQQHRRAEPHTPLRAKDVVRQGLDGHRWGFGLPGSVPWDQVGRVLVAVGAGHLANRPIGVLSGGEQQRIRIAQALVTDPRLLLCDEPLLSLDLASQRTVTALIDTRRREHDTTVVFVTHEINPVLPYVDRVLYLAGGRFRIGTPEQVMTSATLSELYGVPVDVVHSNGRILVAGIPEHGQGHHEHMHDHADDHVDGDDL